MYNQLAMLAMKDKPWLVLFGLLAALSCLPSPSDAAYPYYGTKIGALTRLHHGVSGDVYAVDSRTIFIKKFSYDGEAPAAYFYVGNTARPSNEGATRLRDERGGTASLTRRYRNKDITLSLPEGKTLRDIKWFSVWCDEFAVNFGDVAIPASLDFPRPQKISALRGVHGVSSENIVIVDAQTLLVPNFSYDGEAPDAKFWVGRGQRPTPEGLRIPDENGKENPLRRYERKTIVLTLPEDLTIFDIGHFGVWCEAFTVDFGHVRLPEGLNVPPSLKMLGISPQSKLNCEVLYDDLAFEVRWAVAGESIVVQLVAKLEPNNYMSFGISPNKNISQMIGADAVVAWVDPETGNGFAQDYFLEGKAQCSGSRGACPDTKIMEKTNSIRLLNAAMVNGYSIVTYQRSLAATDRLDLPISVTDAESVVWAIGPLNDYKEVSFHTFYNKHLHQIDFGRQPKWNCPLPEGAKPGSSSAEQEDAAPQPQSSTGGKGYPPAGHPNLEPEEEFYENRAEALHRQPAKRRQETAIITQRRPVPTPKPVNSNGAWDIPAIQCHEPEDGVFYAQMGPTGGKHGYPAITGHVGWGISWYINGLLIPEIHVVRGKTYTFVVEGGNNPDIPAKYHPFYISDDPVGGYEHKREEEKKAVRIFAGVHRSRSGQVTPTGVGRLCNWTPDVEGPPADDYQSFGAYQRTLTLKCDAGEPGVISWKPDRNTPDTVYYHCFTHRYLGWKIHVHDSCEQGGDVGGQGAASEQHEIRLPAAAAAAEPAPVHEDYAAEPSIRHETQKTIGLSEYLRPPQNAPLFHPVKLPGRRPYPGPIKKVPASRPILPQQHPHPHAHAHAHPAAILQQSSLIVNHYRKPVPSLLKPFVKEKPFPLQPIAASVLLLGQPTELGAAGQRKAEHGERSKPKPKPKPVIPVPVPYTDHEPQGSLQSAAYFNLHSKPEQKSVPTAGPSTSTTATIVKRPLQKEPSPQEIANMRPAINQGFKPDTVIVESGFRPIMRTDGSGVQLPPELIEQVAHRREDPGTEIDEVMETDTLFLAAQQGGSETQSFEPMFIPSPLDSTNASVQLKKGVPEADVAAEASALRLPSAAVEHALPSAAQLRKPTLGELFGEDDDLDDEMEGKLDDEELEEQPVLPTKKPTTAAVALSSTTPAIAIPEQQAEHELFDDGMASLFGPDSQEEEIYADELEPEPEDKLAAAAERIDTYYLPPDNRKIPHDSLPSGALYTFDGKSVVDGSLVLPPKLDARDNGLLRHTHYGLTPLEQLIRTTPQFGAYHGELPEEFQSTESPVRPGAQPVTEYSNPVPFSRTSTSVFPSSSSTITTTGSASTIFSHSPTSSSTSSSPSPSISSSSSLRPISTKLHLITSESSRSSHSRHST